MKLRYLIPLLLLALLLSACRPAPTQQPTPQLPTSAPPTQTAAPTASPSPSETPAHTTAPERTSTAEPSPTSLPPIEAAVPLALFSTAFNPGETIPIRHACHGEDFSPPLIWSDPPAGAQSFALIMDDPDAVPVAGFVWDHWLLFNLPSGLRVLPEGIPAGQALPGGGLHGENSFKKLAYGGPCPPPGQTHTYVFTLYALDAALPLEAGVNKTDLLAAMEGHILAQAELIGQYAAP